MKQYVIDACALIAFLNDEKGADKIESILSNQTNLCLMSIINIFEVCYDAAKISGIDEAIKLYEEIKQLPIIIDCKIEENLLKEAIYFKTKYRISVADSIALSLAKVNNAIIITSDHHEFDCIDKAKEIDFYWFR
ncbi:MAG: PIN domain-containing protein [Desulfobacterales bacterium]|nr:PIN domain-containing protein [Desulfobacterales bacterium]